MTKRQIQNELTHRHIMFTEYILSLDKNDYHYSYQNKWTAGQQLEHVVKSTQPVLVGLNLSLWMTQLFFGKSPTGSVDYLTLITRYQDKLATGGKSPRFFVPRRPGNDHGDVLKNRLLLTISRMNLRIEELSERDLDTYRLPHPLLGKLTLREMLFFTIYHVEHHMEQARQNLRYLAASPR